ncbi:MAG: glucose-1-phosphate thymidylyltransferase [Thermoplasmata archaeon]|nr:glucose-1-phosphate thymidylyltransferase [Candidatus Sysuiplasma acidicola]MBX8646674.1 glucose-1-phosphate thymidylyltransferase [Candidatus Sysuiplasma acidicola]
MKGVLLHGGSGTRLRPITHTEVKQLLPVAGKPVSQYALEDMISLGIKEINIIVGSVGAAAVRDYYGDGSKWHVSITYTHQPEPLGIAHAVGLTREFVGSDSFVVYLGDNILHSGLTKLKDSFESGGFDALVALCRVSRPESYGIAELEGGKLVRLVEKPKNPKTNLALVGVYFFRSSIFEMIKKLKPSKRGELEITEAIQALIESGHSVGYHEIKGWWKDTGTMEEILDANRLVLDDMERQVAESIPSQHIIGRVRIMEDSTVDGKSVIKGPCHIGRGTRVKSSIIGPNTSIGNDCVVEGVEIEDSIVMDGCVIDGKGEMRLYESIIGTSCTITKNDGLKKASKMIVGRDSNITL